MILRLLLLLLLLLGSVNWLCLQQQEALDSRESNEAASLRKQLYTVEWETNVGLVVWVALVYPRAGYFPKLPAICIESTNRIIASSSFSQTRWWLSSSN